MAKAPPKPVPAPICPYCSQSAELVTGREIYTRVQHMKLWGKSFWRCVPCQAHVGCHPGPRHVPLGRLADKQLRKAKSAAHREFDLLWKAKVERGGLAKSHALSKAYRWLAAQMNLPVEQTHIGMFDLEQCARVIEICKPFTERLKQRRAA